MPKRLLVCCVVGCGASDVIDGFAAGTIYSPRWPDTYDNSQDCSWVIRAPGGHIILSIKEFATESGYDFLKVGGDS